ncbi:MAG TPA: hypothetical protein VNB22_10765 [Pyrinomonadaceae bacterium]|jgi:hypothetical protein|nr:hypothetical protein [Pyrinomonadaceae bacterium]
MQVQVPLNQYLFVGLLAGFVCGLVPLILGLKKQNIKLGVLGFILSLLAGLPLALLGALPVAGIFTWLILRKPAVAESAQAEAVKENPTDDSINDSENS